MNMNRPGAILIVFFGLIMAIFLVGAGCIPQAGEPDQPDEAVEETADGPSEPVGLANPASVFCRDQGGQFSIVDTERGQAGYCVLPDGRECEEWNFFLSNGEKCGAPVEPGLYAQAGECSGACADAGFDTGECLNPDETATGYIDAGPCQVQGDEKCGPAGECRCYCHIVQ